MWAFIFLCVMGLTICQVTAEERSKQMYYAKLIIDKNAIENITELLRPFVNNTDLKVDFLNKTTTCQNASGVTQCNCSTSYKWSDEVCQSKKECCDSKTCQFPQNAVPMCISQTTILKGSIKMEGNYTGCLAERRTMPFETCNNNVLKEIKKVYSSVDGFEFLNITKYSIGSVTAHFVVNFASDVKSHELINKSKILLQTLSGSLNLETTGVVTLAVPENPVRYYSQLKLKCITKSKLDVQPVWELKKDGITHYITDGTEAKIQTDTYESNLTVENATERWAGEYSCTYKFESKSYTIKHIARAEMNVSLLPVIDIALTPSFPNCQQKEYVKVKVKCEIKKSQEEYNVTWDKNAITAAVTPQPPNVSQQTVVYAAETAISCTPSILKKDLRCKFTNSQNQSKEAEVSITIIYDGERFCKEDGDWEVTKAGFIAKLRCKGADGYRKRKCNNFTEQAIWEEEKSECVNPRVNSLLASAKAVNTGLGFIDENAANIFKDFEKITNDTKEIQGSANIKTSVVILFTLSEKLQNITNNSTIVDLVASSSNLLEESLRTSWTENHNEGNQSAAETYLTSVEHLIEKTNISGTITKKNVEVAVCLSNQGSECKTTLHNANVSIDDSDYGNVKTVAFQQLQEYLPHRDNKTDPNSIVVSTTVEKKKEPVEVSIEFTLLNPRPRDVAIYCVSWSNSTRQWSSDGCEWKGGGKCFCTHLSSFAILMSKHPITLPAMKEITVVGLSVSIISLTICIVIQLIVWSAVVKSNTLYIRQVANFNISLCSLLGDCCFLATNQPKISKAWCVTVTVLKHFCYLSMFFWMLCLSCILLYQAVFVFHNVGKKIYLKCSLVLGYVCPFLIVSVTFLSYSAGAENSYYSMETCWLVYNGPFRGSIHSFVLPIAIIVFINVFTMGVVIVKLLDLQKTETANENDKTAAKTVMRTIILLTPVFGVTWLLGFGVMLLDLTSGYVVYAVNYAFVLLNTFQGLFILLTTCLGDKSTRDALLRRFKKMHGSASITESTTKLDSSLKK
ncbi:adhesion G protein-coupled receptor F4 [Echeneis naucrates]|uniref:Adhesion G protein-coupled receptor F4-like n=1 Tax=Echeneis naucrates TaxID=173247 RepID=A0A665XCZ3_ECHNA|nr:adhesion G protein-coupled receptor F4-like [Echeneis naucrates]